MKSLLKRILRRVGWELRRIPAPPATAPTTPRRHVVGGLDLEFPPHSRIPEAYAFYPDYGLELVTAAGLVAAKYPSGIGVDVGANVGDTIALMRRQTTAKIHAFEGDQETLGYLRRNASVLGDVEIVPQFLDAVPQQTAIQTDKAGWNTTLQPAADGKPVSFTTLDEYFANRPDAAAVKLIKIDCEGYDNRVLRGGRQLLARSHPIILFEYHARCLHALHEDGPSVFADLAALGYETVVLFDHAGNLIMSAPTHAADLWADFDRYTRTPGSPLLYLDAACFHAADADLATAMKRAHQQHALRPSPPPPA